MQIEDESPAAEWVPPTYEQWHAIVDAIAAKGYKATLEGGGAACAFIQVDLPDGRILAFGDANEEWGADVYASADAMSEGTVLEDKYLDTNLPNTERDPAKVAQAFVDAITKEAK